MAIIQRLFGADRDTKLISICMCLCALFLAIKHYPGIENSPYYAGFILNAIDPSLLANDPIVGRDISSTSPYKFTAYYLLPKLFGEIWLDDRFIFPLYVLTVGLSFFFADRIAVHIGAKNLWVRAAVQLIFLRDHQVLENQINFAHQPDFHHSAMAMPLSLFVLYVCIRGGKILPIILSGLLLAAFTMQVAPFTIGFALAAIAIVETGRERLWARGILAFGLIACFIGMFTVLSVSEPDRSPLWHEFLFNWYDGMVRPFDPEYGGWIKVAAMNILFGLLMAAAILWPSRTADEGPTRRIRAIITLAATLWIVLGLFVQYAPESLQYPQFLIFPLTRQLQGPQALAIIAATVFVLNWATERPNKIRTAVTGFTFLLLVVAGPGNYWQWTIVFLVALSLSIGATYLYSARYVSAPLGITTPIAPSMVMAMLLTFVIAFGYSLSGNGPKWVHMLRTGIYGGSAAATWTNIAPYIRENTEKNAVILPLQYWDASGGRTKLKVLRNIASRSGRAVPFPMRLSKGLNLDWFKFASRQYELHEKIGTAWIDGEGDQALEAIDQLIPRPTHIVAPDGSPAPASGRLALEKVISLDGYTLYKLVM